jgi:hypothetical protein
VPDIFAAAVDASPPERVARRETFISANHALEIVRAPDAARERTTRVRGCTSSDVCCAEH